MLKNCAAYRDGIKLADITVSEISDYVDHPDTVVWVSLREGDDEELRLMQGEFGLHELAVEDASHGHQRPKIEEYGDSLFVAMHLIELTPDDSFEVGEINVFVGDNYVLSIRNRSRQLSLGVRERCEKDSQLLRQGPGFILYALMDAVVDQYFPLLQEFETRLEIIEGQIFNKGEARSNIEKLYALKQNVMVLKHAVSPLMEATTRLAGGRPPKLCISSKDYFRDVLDHLTRIDSSIDAMRDTIGTAIQVNLAMVTIEESEINKKLAAWAGIFAVATAFAGIWGMNFTNMPELKWEYGYPAALCTIFVACFLLRRHFKKVGWL